LGIGLVGQDYAVPGLADPIKVGSPVKVVRVLEEIVTEQEPIAHETAWQPDPDLEIDNRRVAQQGAPGILHRRIRVRYEDGHEVSRVLEDEWVAREPAAHIMAYGTLIVPRILDTPDGPVEYWRKIRMLATSYTAATSGKAGDHPSYGVTAVGLPMRKGIVAVDPRLINLYQQVYVAGYGLGTAADTGGAIKGRRIDLGYDDDNLVLWYNWVDVYLLMPPPDPAKIRYLLPD
jgi:resuscitation-promoting factor RpfB